MAFRNKYKKMYRYNPDIMVIPECEDLSKKKHEVFYNDFKWVGLDGKKGLGIFSLNEKYKLKIHENYTEEFQYIVPVVVSNDDESFLLFAVWTKGNKSMRKEETYIGQLYLALLRYEHLLNEKCIIAGDFNSNAIWDNLRRKNHSTVVELLMRKNISSVYHKMSGEETGKETVYTYLHNSPKKPYHIDYIFASESLISKSNHFNIESLALLSELNSDHVPLIFEFK
ncbi:endonuclease/exonuclease/phosphatase family protein [Paenibacillus sp. R14(2021)]|uniref:endonuclease/exonuclease/phosphatase family protein n=1 Tax=Paenibacillus sp. R14(2021) TaxID=2859228 RepID=UPI0035BE78BF